MRFKLYMDMAIALKSITENIIKPGRDLVHEISTGFLLLENKLKMVIPFSQPGPRPENRTVELIK